MDRIPLRAATNLRNHVIPIIAGLSMPPGRGWFSHFLYLTDTQLPWMSGYNYPPPPSGGCVRDYWLVCGGSAGSRAEQFPDRPQEQPGTVQPHTRSQWFNNVTFSAKTMGEKTPHMIGAKSWFVTPSLPWSAPFLHLMCTIDSMVPASRFPYKKTIFFILKKKHA